ncbi:hypothetical protein BZA05DRAFT_242272 [Tricharina praecox]|uniref:uncharacterized protein n=1 Tax=Tricharina praecox TaxID=43433 RepID=UPI00221F09E8|nr:uncharacterized protein BZA05DRAFT_242272 [Tricharina praecox]KAI5840915.1 hypothetical protein BZA05DRAFT_242272 [Tricharina praecox]
MHPLRRLSAWGGSTTAVPVLPEGREKDQQHRHRHRLHSSEKKYDTLPLGGNRPIVTTAVSRITTADEREKEREKRHRRRRRHQRSADVSSASSVASGSTGSRSSRSSRKSSHPTEEPITGAVEKRKKRSSAGFAETEMDAGVSIVYPYSPTSINSTPASSPTEPIGFSAEPRRRGTDGSVTSTPVITTTPPTPTSPLEQARKRNSHNVTFLSSSPSEPPYPITPPPADYNMDSRSRRSEYLAYSPPPLSDIHPALRPGSPNPPLSPSSPNPPTVLPLRPRANTTPGGPHIPPAGSNFPPHRSTSHASHASTPSTSSSLPHRLLSRKEDAYQMLQRFDTVLVVDDSASMTEHWDATRKALESVATVALKHDQDGLDVYFMNHPEHSAWNVRSAAHIRRLFALVEPSGITPTGECLDDILRDYLDRYAASKNAYTPASSPVSPHAPALKLKPLNILVLTDGEPTDDPESVIVDAARQLERLNAPLHQVGIQFLQIGDEPGAREALEELDDALAAVHGIRDMVDTTRYSAENGEISGEVLLKAMLGGVNRRLDRKG